MTDLATMESMFNDKLHSNYVPNDDEVDIIKELLVEPDRKLLDISGEIEGIKAQLEKLLKEKEDLNEQLKAHKALLSPARRLPTDVIQRIFLHALPSGRNPVLSSKEAPLLLGRICSQWRDIALGTPKLWSALHIAIPSDPPMPMPIGAGPPPTAPQTDHSIRIQAITSWLSRSDPYPLSISVYNSRYDNVAGNSVQSYLDAILTFAARWSHLHMSVPHQVWNTFLPRVRSTDVPILEKVYLDSSIGYHGAPGSPGIGSRRDSGLLKATNLRSVSLIQFEPHVLHLPLRWRRLTELNLSGSVPTWQPVEGLSITETLAILLLCPNLEYFSVQLSLAGFSPLPDGDCGLPQVTLNKLSGLAVTETNNVDSAPFFQHLTAPDLRYLKFRRTSPNSYITPPDFAQGHSLKLIHIPLALFIRRVNRPIEEFDLDALYMTEGDVMRCLSLMPGLKRLSLWTYGASNTAATPYTTPTVPPWENTLFTFEDRHMKRFVPGLVIDETNTHFGPNLDYPQSYISASSAGSMGWGVPYNPAPYPPYAPAYTPNPPLQTPPLQSSPPASTSILPLPGTPPQENSSSDQANDLNQDDDPTGSSDAIIATATTVRADEVANDSTSNDSRTTPSRRNSVRSRRSSVSSRRSSSSFPFTPLPLPPSLSKDKGKARATESEVFAETVEVDVSDILCPLLEDFQCSGAVFSDETMLAFLRARSSLAAKPNPSTSCPQPSSSKGVSSSSAEKSLDDPYELAHLRRCRISFSLGREDNDEIREKLEEIRKETGMNLDVHYPPKPMSAYYRRYSPYDGLPSIPVLGPAPGANTNGGVNTISTTGGLASGEPVFLYSAAFH